MIYAMLAVHAAFIAAVIHHVRQGFEELNAPWRERLAEMSKFSESWGECKADELNLFDTRLGKKTPARFPRFNGFIDVDVNGVAMQFFDWQTGAVASSVRHILKVRKRGYGKHSKQPIFPVIQTAVVFTPQNLDMAAFSVHSKVAKVDDIGLHHPMLQNGLSFQQPVATGTWFDADYQLTSIQPYLTQQVFNSETGRKKLIPLIEDWGLTVEWTEKNLLVYRIGHALPPWQFQDFASVVLELAELLHEADAAADKQVEERINANAHA